MSETTTATYAWVITKDHIADDAAPLGTNQNAVGVSGPEGATAEQILEASLHGEPFRLLDDDGEVYYEGRCLCNESEDDFGPLDDFGTPNAGCTEIQYRDRSGKWVGL